MSPLLVAPAGESAAEPASAPGQPLSLAVARYRYTATFEHDLELPVNAGALLHSVFGLALRQGNCVTGAPACPSCPLYRSCAYPALFEAPPRPTQLGPGFSQVPNPYVMEAPPLGTTRIPARQALQWGQVLVGDDALRQLPIVVSAWERSLRNGWGRQRVQGQLTEIVCVSADGAHTPVKTAHDPRLKPHLTRLSLPSELRVPAYTVHLHLDSPLRLQHGGRPVRPADLSPRKLVADLLRRCNLMLDLHVGLRPAPFDARALVAHASTLTDDRSALRWRDDTRYSSRQQQETPLCGAVGRWTLHGELAPLLPWLWLGQWLHLGKGATMGQGAYRLEWVA